MVACLQLRQTPPEIRPDILKSSMLKRQRLAWPLQLHTVNKPTAHNKEIIRVTKCLTSSFTIAKEEKGASFWAAGLRRKWRKLHVLQWRRPTDVYLVLIHPYGSVWLMKNVLTSWRWPPYAIYHAEISQVQPSTERKKEWRAAFWGARKVCTEKYLHRKVKERLCYLFNL